MKALIVEDDKMLSGCIGESLKNRFEMTQAFDGEEGLTRLYKDSFDIVILDAVMSKLNGFEVLEQLRESGITTPVIMISSLKQPADEVRALRTGADDFIPKPLDLDVLHARIDALLRRTVQTTQQTSVYSFLDMTLDTKTRIVRIGENKLDLSGKQFDFLLVLVQNKNVIVNKESLFHRIWGFYSSTENSVIAVYASQIRTALRMYDYEKYLKTVRGLGYILTDDSGLYA